MIIREISCEQFAGLKDRKYEFEDGLNIIIGDNESGKSSIVDLMYQIFFKEINIGAQSTEDRQFTKVFFPKGTGAVQGDVVDGTLKFETSEGIYRIKKEWARKGGALKLTMPDGTIIQDTDKIKEVIDDALGYGKGVYDELVFASQRRPHKVIDGIFGEKSNSIEELSALVTNAVMATGGLDLDAMEKDLNEKLLAYSNNWDFDKDQPKGGNKRGIDNKWVKNVGKILAAYYEKEEITQAQSDAEEAEQNLESIITKLEAVKIEKREVEEKSKSFAEVKGALEQLETQQQLLEREKKDLDAFLRASTDWPKQQKNLKRAETLKKEKSASIIKSSYDDVKKINGELEEITGELEGYKKWLDIESATIGTAKETEEECRSIEAQINGMNLQAVIKKTGDKDILVKSSLSDDASVVGDGIIDITEATDIIVEDVIEINLVPKGVDIEKLKASFTQKKNELKEILSKYDVKSASELEEKYRKVYQLKENADKCRERIDDRLSDIGKTWEELNNEAESIDIAVRSEDEINDEIRELCGYESLDAFIGANKNGVEAFEKEYGTMDALNEKIENVKETILEIEKKVESIQNVPEEYKGIADLEEYAKNLSDKIAELDSAIEDLGNDQLDAAKKIGETTSEEYTADLEKAEKEFEKQKADYIRWKHISDELTRIVDASKGNPLEDVEKYFKEHLSILSSGRIVLDSVDESFKSNISSGSSSLDADILSHGTKDTIYLAFRLAVLRHLFPNGGCTAVFDDSFSEMDPTRTGKACELIEEFAKENQVLFISCDPKYKDIMSGNEINM